MNKLIKLLNKYLKYKEDIGPDKLTRVKSVDTTGDIIFELNNGGYWNLWYVISKEFGFIKWLVDNDKIDRDRCECRQLYNALKRSEDDHGDKNFSKCERIIMLLAIQDEPIKFLISILK